MEGTCLIRDIMKLCIFSMKFRLTLKCVLVRGVAAIMPRVEFIMLYQTKRRDDSWSIFGMDHNISTSPQENFIPKAILADEND